MTFQPATHRPLAAAVAPQSRLGSFCAATSQVPSRSSRASPSDRSISLNLLPNAPPEVHKWTEEYAAQPASSVEAGASGGSLVLPIMTLKKVKVPTDTVQLQIFEPRYRLMFRLVNQSRTKMFGVALADSETGLMEGVGALCELTHFVPIPERRRIFISARAVGRYEVVPGGVISDKPFVAARCQPYGDERPAGMAEAAQLAALEARTWQGMNEVRQLTSKLFARGGQAEFGDEIFNLETRRFCPDPAVRAAVPVAAGSDPALMQACEQAGLLGDGPAAEAREGAHEYICSDARREFTEAERRERLSFALLRALDVDEHGRLEALLTRSTAERLRSIEALVLEGRAHLAARSTLKDLF